MEPEQKFSSFSSNDTVEDHITWLPSFWKIAELMAFRILCSGTKANKPIPDIPIYICDKTLY